MRYRYFDLTIESEIDLPELVCSVDAPALRISRTAIDEGFEADLCHEWRDANESVQLTVGRTDEFWLMELPGADCLVSRDLEEIFVHSDARGSTERHLLLDQVIPRVVAQSGRLVLHASAVEVPSGHVYLLAGNSGVGKSTLAAALAAQGGILLADDCVLIDFQRGVRCIGNYRGVRLFPDSLATLSIDPQDTSDFADGSAKRRVRASAEDPVAGRVSGILFLSRAGMDTAEISPVSGSGQLMSLISQRFSLDPTDHALATRQLALASELCRSIPCYRLSIPDDLARLASACTSILELDAA